MFRWEKALKVMQKILEDSGIGWPPDENIGKIIGCPVLVVYDRYPDATSPSGETLQALTTSIDSLNVVESRMVLYVRLRDGDLGGGMRIQHLVLQPRTGEHDAEYECIAHCVRHDGSDCNIMDCSCVLLAT